MVNHIQVTKQTLIERINKCRNCSGDLSSTRLNADKTLYDDLKLATSFLPESTSYSERIYCILNDIDTLQVCTITGKPLRWSPNTKHYRPSRAEFYTSKRGQPNLKLRHTLKLKGKSTRLQFDEVYKSGNYIKMDLDEIKYKLNRLHELRVPLHVLSKNIELFCNVLEKTLFIPIGDNVVVYRRYDWGQRMYCILHDITSPVLTKDGLKAAFINGVVGYSKYSEDITADTQLKVVNHITSHGFTIVDIPYSGLTKLKYITIRCNKCNTEREQFVRCGYWKDPYCEKCYGTTGRSKLEDNIIDFISKSVDNLKIEKNWLIPGSRKEIDIYLPELNIGFEICGTLWHSYGTKYPNTARNEKEKKHHISNKVDLANKNGITLYTIFGHEWETNQDKIKHMILSKLGKYNERLYARKCDVREIDKITKRDFLNDYHLQNNDNSQRYFGLFNKDRLVSVMTFGTRKITRADAELEMIRYCSLPGVQIIGGASKLLKNAMITLGVTTVKTYCDRRFSNGDFYKSIGFELIRTSKPNFWFTKDCKKLLHRMSFQRHKIVNETNKHMKTDDIIYSIGYRKLYDAGNYVFKTTHVDYK